MGMIIGKLDNYKLTNKLFPPKLHPTQNQFKMDYRNELKLDTIKLLEENLGNKLLDMNLGDVVCF